MKQVRFKIITSLVLFVMIFNLIGRISWAVSNSNEVGEIVQSAITQAQEADLKEDDDQKSEQKTTDWDNKHPETKNEDKVAENINNGLSNLGSGSKDDSSITGKVVDGVIGVLTLGIRIFVVVIGSGAQLLISTTANSAGSLDDSKTVNMVTPDQILFNRLAITDINFFQKDSFGSGSNKKTLSGTNNPVKLLRESIAKWYYALRTMAIMILLIILIYIGIRMATSTLADDKAKYKSMLWNWLVSMAIVFVLHYLIIAVITINNSLVDILYTFRRKLLQRGRSNGRFRKQSNV